MDIRIKRGGLGCLFYTFTFNPEKQDKGMDLLS